MAVAFDGELSSDAATTIQPRHFRALVDSLAAAIYTTDIQGRVTYCNRSAVELWGREPVLGDDQWCGSWRIYRPDGSPLAIDQCPMAVSIREGRSIRGEEIVVERPDGTRRNVLPHPDPIRDCSGNIIGAVNMLVDITDRRTIERALSQSQERLQVVFNQAAVGITLMDQHGRILEANERACQIVGRDLARLRACNCRDLVHPDDWASNESMLRQVIEGRRKEFVIEKRYLRGQLPEAWVWVSVAFTGLLDDRGHPHRLIAVIEDITERKLFREELERHTRERTAELERAQRSLREGERLAALGTLSAGLGHDLANLLLPLRGSLDTLESTTSPPTPEQLATEVGAIRRGLDYLQRLSAGLRLLAVDPASRPSAIERTMLGAWWTETEGVLRAVLLRGAALDARIAPDLPPVNIARAALTQAVFNLVQNAAEAMDGAPNSVVSLAAERAPAAADGRPRVRITVSDNGPGMTTEAFARCFEPYFSTKQRAIATGLGLSLVRTHIVGAGGTISCESTPGGGVRFIIDLLASDEDVLSAMPPMTARVAVHSPRTAALATALLEALHIDVVAEGPLDSIDLLVVQSASALDLRQFDDDKRGPAAVVLQAPASLTDSLAHHDRIVFCGENPNTRTLQAAFERAATILRSNRRRDDH